MSIFFPGVLGRPFGFFGGNYQKEKSVQGLVEKMHNEPKGKYKIPTSSATLKSNYSCSTFLGLLAY